MAFRVLAIVLGLLIAGSAGAKAQSCHAYTPAPTKITTVPQVNGLPSLPIATTVTFNLQCSDGSTLPLTQVGPSSYVFDSPGDLISKAGGNPPNGTSAVFTLCNDTSLGGGSLTNTIPRPPLNGVLNNSDTFSVKVQGETISGTRTNSPTYVAPPTACCSGNELAAWNYNYNIRTGAYSVTFDDFLSLTGPEPGSFDNVVPGATCIAVAEKDTDSGSTSLTWPTLPTDQVVLTNRQDSSQTGLWVNGLVNGAPWNHYTIGPSTDPTLDLGFDVTPSSNLPYGNEVVGFTYNRPPTIQTPIPWAVTSDLTHFDTVPLQFRRTTNVPIKFWILYGGVLTRIRAVADLSLAWYVWRKENLGFSPSNAGFGDESSNPNAAAFDNFDCSQIPKLQAINWTTPGMINVYYVHQIAGAAPGYFILGKNCAPNISDDVGGAVVAISSRFSLYTLVHELGHALSLQHTGSGTTLFAPGFDDNNIMWQGSPGIPTFLSEGQTFRTNFNPGSALNFLYNLSPSFTRHCAHGALESLDCPALNRRIWADGALLPTPNPPIF